jgi:Putative peptidoglycan binding domain.
VPGTQASSSFCSSPGAARSTGGSHDTTWPAGNGEQSQRPRPAGGTRITARPAPPCPVLGGWRGGPAGHRRADGSSFVKSPQQIAADTAAPPPTVTTAKVVSQILTSSVQMRGVVYPGTQYDVYPSAPETGASGTGTGSPAGGSATGGGSSAAVYISRLDVAAGQTISNGEKLAEIDGEPLFALAGRVPAWRDITPGESGPDVAELQKALASLGYYTGGDTPGFFGTPTQDAVSLYYEHLGYTAPATGGVPHDGRDLPAVAAREGDRW